MNRRSKSLCICLICLTLISGCKSQNNIAFSLDYTNEYTNGHPEKTYALTGGGTTLSVDEKTMEIRMENQNRKWSSYVEAPEKLEGTDLTPYRTTVSVLMYDMSGNKIEMNSWRDCVMRNQYIVTQTSDAIEIMMVLGQTEVRRALPYIIRESEFERVVNALSSARDQKKLRSYYKLYADESENYYTIRDTVEKEQRELEGLFKQTGYTAEDAEEEHRILNYAEKSEVVSPPVIQLSIILCIDNGEVTVQIPTDKISFDQSTYILNRVTVLPNFLAIEPRGGGSIFIPDGSGALIRMDDSDKLTGQITRRVYGNDPSTDVPQDGHDYLIPVYGTCDTAGAMLVVIEHGGEMAEIAAIYQGALNAKATVYQTFIYNEYAVMSTNTSKESATLNLYDKNNVAEEYTIRFIPLTEDRDYVGLAQTFRQYLLQKGILRENAATGFYSDIETLGSVASGKHVLGFNVSKNYLLTTFEEDAEIVSALQSGGLGSIHLLLKGASNGGLGHNVMNTYKPESSLGGRKGFNQLLKSVEKNTVQVLPDIDYVTAYESSGRVKKGNMARGIEKYYTNLGKRSIVVPELESSSMVMGLAPSLIQSYGKRVFESLSEMGIQQYLLSGVGETLYSDMKTAKNRSFSMNQIAESLENSAGNAAIRKGFYYTWSRASSIIDLPVLSSGHQDTANIPFLQIVLHGFLPFSGSSVNLYDDYDTAVLHCIETGAMPHYTFAMKNTEILTNTEFSEYYSVQFSYWKEQAINSIQRIETAVGDLSGEAITGHQALQNGVYRTDYGTQTILTNYNDFEVTVGNFTVNAKDYLRMATADAPKGAGNEQK